MKEKTKVEASCQGLLSIPVKRIRPFTNLVMACSSQCAAKSVVELTSSQHFQYYYSNSNKVSEYLTKKEEDYEKTLKIFFKYFLHACSVEPQFEEVLGNYYVFGQDMCMVDKTHSSCLAGRFYEFFAKFVFISFSQSAFYKFFAKVVLQGFRKSRFTRFSQKLVFTSFS